MKKSFVLSFASKPAHKNNDYPIVFIFNTLYCTLFLFKTILKFTLLQMLPVMVILSSNDKLPMVVNSDFSNYHKMAH